ncbi:MAG: hypothetical protein OHK0046_15780 [Anaerolineae bacterium]
MLNLTSALRDLLHAESVMFIAPLPLHECLHRLKNKSLFGGDRSSKLEVDLYRRRIEAYEFHLTRTLKRLDITGKRVMARGTFEYWEEDTTLVTCRPQFNYFDWMYILPALPTVMGLAMIVSGSSGALLLTIALLMLPISLLGHIHNVQAHRDLVHLIDDLLREPLFLGGRYREDAATLGDLLHNVPEQRLNL